VSDLHKRIAEAVGWTEEEAKSFSLPALREVVRPVDAKLAYEISVVMNSPSYVVEEWNKHRSPTSSKPR